MLICLKLNFCIWCQNFLWAFFCQPLRVNVLAAVEDYSRVCRIQTWKTPLKPALSPSCHAHHCTAPVLLLSRTPVPGEDGDTEWLWGWNWCWCLCDAGWQSWGLRNQGTQTELGGTQQVPAWIGQCLDAHGGGGGGGLGSCSTLHRIRSAFFILFFYSHKLFLRSKKVIILMPCTCGLCTVINRFDIISFWKISVCAVQGKMISSWKDLACAANILSSQFKNRLCKTNTVESLHPYSKMSPVEMLFVD